MSHSENVPPPSPKWVKPSDVLKLRKKLKPGTTQLPVPSSCVLKPVDQNVLANRTKDAVFNPFRKEAQKRKINLLEEDHIYRNENEKHFVLTKTNDIITELLDDNANFGFANESGDEKKEPIIQCCSVLPVDWSLKTKLRFISTKSFPLKGCLKTLEESSGTTSFVRCLHSSRNQECTVDTSANARFHQQCLVWMFPSIPWLDLFPRLSNTSAINSSSLFSNNIELQDSLHDAWCDSFRSLYQLVRARQCPYFYLCSATFTAVFRAAGIASFSDHHVLVTPTTRGFRQSLREEGINFTMPLQPFHQDGENSCDGENTSSLSDGPSPVESSQQAREDLDCKVNIEEDEPGIWLESLGLSQNDFPALNPKRRKTDQLNVDHRPQSLVCIEGPETQALVNFLLNSRSCVANTGSLAGVPPTLLSPCAFHGATLHPLKVRQARMNREQNCIEITGPILPNTLDGLCTLFNGTQDGHFEATMKTLVTTEAFTLLTQKSDAYIPSIFATENLKDSGLCPSFLQQVCRASSPGAKQFCEINVTSSLFSWK